MYIPVTLDFLDGLKNIISKVFDTVLSPVLKNILNVLFEFAGSLFMSIFGSIFLTVYVVLLKLVDWLAAIFDIFSGARYMYVNGRQAYLLDYLMNLDTLKTSFLYITVLAATLGMLFTIYTVMKSVSDMTLDGKNPLGKVLGRALKTGVTFMLVPLFIIFGLELGNIVVVKVSNAIMGDSAKTTIGSVIFLTTSLNAAKDSRLNPGAFGDSLRQKYLAGDNNFSSLEGIQADFNSASIDYVTGYIISVVVILIMIGCIFMFVRRIFDVLILYVVSPLFVCTMPLDDGAIFGKWRDMFVAKLVSGYGAIFTMKLFLSFVPIFYGTNLVLSNDPSVDGILRLFIIIGGAWATYKSQHTILSVISPEMAREAQQTTGAVIGLAANAAGGLGGKAGQAMRQAAGGGK